ncbi:hypothetical protein [Methanolobus sp. ZRKC5]|uniref:hypothetical protein n=1 Tax=unclassified Methanolobus TaxID=2629569 RepID=UPI00313EFFC2
MSDTSKSTDIELEGKEDKSLHSSAKVHRRIIRRVMHRGFKSHIRACPVCGHYICRCQDIKRGDEVNKKVRK